MLFIGACEDGIANLDVMPLCTKQNTPFTVQDNYSMFVRVLIKR